LPKQLKNLGKILGAALPHGGHIGIYWAVFIGRGKRRTPE
jgi:hypothetical protein